MSNDMAWGLDVSLPQLTVLETISEDPKRIDEGYQILEKLFRTFFRRAKFRLRPQEDAFDYFVRKSASLLKAPYALKRQKQFRNVRAGVEQLVRAAVSAKSGMADDFLAFRNDRLKKLIEMKAAPRADSEIPSESQTPADVESTVEGTHRLHS